MLRFLALNPLTQFFFCLVFTTASVSISNADQPSKSAITGLKDLDGHFPMVVPKTLTEWNTRAKELNLQVRVALGLHPAPTLSVAEPIIHGRRKMAGYTVEKIYFESLPGFFVTASLYRPTEIVAPKQGYPAVMYAHGHWEKGRFYEASREEALQLLATGAERFENAAINQLQAACVQLARMGCIVLQYDMIGYADSVQISFDRAHRFGINIDNPACAPNEWLLYSAKAESYGQSIMGLQAINSLRAFELLRSMPEIDANRIAITGASGGGTQSFITAAIEPGIAGAFPAVMVSTGMQGGCTCENACGLRVNTGNVEIASLIAPRPLAMTTARDWTLNMPEDGYPELQKLYGLFGKQESVDLHPGPQFPHNYNHVARVSMYGFMNQLFQLGMQEPILEKDFDLLRADQLTVWTDAHPRPASGIEFEKKLVGQWAGEVTKSLYINEADSSDTKSSKQNLLLEGWTSIASPCKAISKKLSSYDSGNGVTLVRFEPESAAVGRVEKQESNVGNPSTEIDLVFADALDSYDSTSQSVFKITVADPINDNGDTQPLVENPRRVAAYTYCYNAPRIIRRLGVLLRIVEDMSAAEKQPIRVVVSAQDAFLAAAAVLCLNDENGSPIQKVVVIGSREDAVAKLSDIDSIVADNFLPGYLRYQGLEGLLSVVDGKLFTFQE